MIENVLILLFVSLQARVRPDYGGLEHVLPHEINVQYAEDITRYRVERRDLPRHLSRLGYRGLTVEFARLQAALGREQPKTSVVGTQHPACNRNDELLPCELNNSERECDLCSVRLAHIRLMIASGGKLSSHRNLKFSMCWYYNDLFSAVLRQMLFSSYYIVLICLVNCFDMSNTRFFPQMCRSSFFFFFFFVWKHVFFISSLSLFDSLLLFCVDDENRIIISGWTGDYINASSVEGFGMDGEFIATQSPLPETVQDFWAMVWQSRTHTIVMLARNDEFDGEDVVRYWPGPDERFTYGEVSVMHDGYDPATSIRPWAIRYFKMSVVSRTFSGLRVFLLMAHLPVQSAVMSSLVWKLFLLVCRFHGTNY